ncbi:class I tRNA ligase family protein, partial [Flavobacterium sp.]|uniref:class I tRNA ligase family protein n=1 Tax=Flavobacterium sp. TaxID=239 RepID=UPI002C228FCA
EWYWNTKTNAVSSPPSEELEEAFIFPLELNTMPGWAGSSWYWMRYMDAHNDNEFASKEALDYWQNVDLYIGGSEHATGHLLYSRFWNKFLKDKGFAPTEEPFKKLINQGMILGMSAYAYRVLLFSVDGVISLDNFKLKNPILVSFDANPNVNYKTRITSEEDFTQSIRNIIRNENNLNAEFQFYIDPVSNIDIGLIDEITNELDIEKMRNHPMYAEYKKAHFITDSNKPFVVGRIVEKMSKSKYNVVNPDDICNEYGADTLRLYEMFLGPLEQAKPWNTAGITGVYGFLKKLWKLYHSGPNDSFYVDNSTPSEGLGEAFKSLHKTIKKVTEDIENFSFNTSVSQFMICVNELSQLKCRHRAILEPLAIIISPYAPHIAEELWSQLGHEGSIATVDFPVFEEKYLVESEKEYPVSFNGKMRFTIKLPLDLTAAQIEEIIMADERTIAQLAGNTPKKVIIVPGKIINLVG